MSGMLFIEEEFELAVLVVTVAVGMVEAGSKEHVLKASKADHYVV